MNVDDDRFDAFPVGVLGEPVVVEHRFELGVERQHLLLPLTELDFPASQRPQPVSLVTLDRQTKMPGGE